MKPLVVLLFVLPVYLPAVGQPKHLTPHEVAKLVPDEVKGFHAAEEFKSKQVDIGTISYALSEKSFNKGEKRIKILLFDFKDAPIMYTQAMRKWSNNDSIESDSLVLRVVALDNCTGWESYHKQTETSQIFLGVCERFFLTLTGEKVELDRLKEVVGEIQLAKFPK